MDKKVKIFIGIIFLLALALVSVDADDYGMMSGSYDGMMGNWGGMMSGSYGYGWMGFGWIISLLIVVVLVLLIVYLIKKIQSN